MDNELPKRAHSVVIYAGADEQEDLVYALTEILAYIKGGGTDRVSGGYSFGYSIKYQHDSEMTHDKYMAAIGG